MTEVHEQTWNDLIELAKTDPRLRNVAVSAIVKSAQLLQHPEAIELVRENLRGDPPHTELLARLQFRLLDTFPEQFALFFYDDSRVRSHARQYLKQTSLPNSLEIFNRLLDVLNDPEQAEKHANAIRALAASSLHLSKSDAGAALKNQSIEHLTAILRSGDQSLIGPALFALDSIGGNKKDSILQDLKTDDTVPEERRQLLGDAQLIEDLRHQELVLFHRESQ